MTRIYLITRHGVPSIALTIVTVVNYSDDLFYPRACVIAKALERVWSTVVNCGLSAMLSHFILH